MHGSLMSNSYSRLYVLDTDRNPASPNDVFQMPLNGVDPIFQIEIKFDAFGGIRIDDGCVHVVGRVVVADGLVKNPVA